MYVCIMQARHTVPNNHLNTGYIYPVSRKYLAMASAPRLKLISSPELKAFRLPSWLEGMCMHG
ncbi:hypothetical protein Hanom_Chr16g01521911 [Helianthus anomalus]